MLVDKRRSSSRIVDFRLLSRSRMGYVAAENYGVNKRV